MPRHSTPFANARARRHGVTLIETLVSLGLLVTVFGAVTPLLVRQTQMVSQARSYRLAVDELTNQLDLLSALPTEEADEMIRGISPRDPSLSEASIEAEVKPIEGGRRVTLTLTWPEAARPRPAVSLIGWLIEPVGEDG